MAYPKHKEPVAYCLSTSFWRLPFEGELLRSRWLASLWDAWDGLKQFGSDSHTCGRVTKNRCEGLTTPAFLWSQCLLLTSYQMYCKRSWTRLANGVMPCIALRCRCMGILFMACALHMSWACGNIAGADWLAYATQPWSESKCVNVLPKILARRRDISQEQFHEDFCSTVGSHTPA